MWLRRCTVLLAESIFWPSMRSDTMPDRPDLSWGDQKNFSSPSLILNSLQGSVFFSASASLPVVKSSTSRSNVKCQLLLSSLVHSHSAHSIFRTTKTRERTLDVMSELWSCVKFMMRSDRLEMTAADLSHSFAGKRFKIYNDPIIIWIHLLQNWKYRYRI